VAYQLLIVVAGGTGSAGGGNPFKGQILAYICHWEDKFWAGSFYLLCLVFDQLGIK